VSEGIPPELTARLAPGEAVLLHHRADAGIFRFWRILLLAALAAFLAVVLGMFAATSGDAPMVAKAAPALVALLILFVAATALHLFGRRLRRFDAIATPRRLLWANGAELTFTPGLMAMSIGPVISIQRGLGTYRLYFPANRSETAALLNRILIATSNTRGPDA
jgi:hypothetical protein